VQWRWRSIPRLGGINREGSVMNRISRFLFILLLGSILLPRSSYAADDNLLQNPGFDSWRWKSHWRENSPGYTDVGVTHFSSNVYSSPNAAKFWAHNYVVDRTITLSQKFDDITAGWSYTASALLKNNSGSSELRDGAYAYVGLEWYDNYNHKIGSTSLSDLLTAANDAWEEFSVTSVAPDDAAYGKILLGLYSPAMSYCSSAIVTYFDNASVTVTPEPLSCVLFLTGGAALFLRRRKKGAGF